MKKPKLTNKSPANCMNRQLKGTHRLIRPLDLLIDCMNRLLIVFFVMNNIIGKLMASSNQCKFLAVSWINNNLGCQ